MHLQLRTDIGPLATLSVVTLFTKATSVAVPFLPFFCNATALRA